MDIVCVGFGPATGGFLTTLGRGLAARAGTPAGESRVAPGLPLQVTCFERADDIGAGVSGVVTRARGIRASFPDLDPAQIPMAAAVRHETVAYLLDPVGASRRSAALRAADAMLRTGRGLLPLRHDAIELPYVPDFLRKDGGLLLSLGQFSQWVGSQVLATGAVQIWPASPVAQALVEDGGVAGVRLVDQGTERDGAPAAGYLPGMDVRAALTVVGDGPVGVVGRQLDEVFGMPGRRATARLGGRHEDGRRPARDVRARARHRPPHARLSRARDLRLPLRAAPSARRRSASSCRRGSTARSARPTATCSTGCCTRTSGGT